MFCVSGVDSSYLRVGGQAQAEGDTGQGVAGRVPNLIVRQMLLLPVAAAHLLTTVRSIIQDSFCVSM